MERKIEPEKLLNDLLVSLNNLKDFCKENDAFFAVFREISLEKLDEAFKSYFDYTETFTNWFAEIRREHKVAYFLTGKAVVPFATHILRKEMSVFQKSYKENDVEGMRKAAKRVRLANNMLLYTVEHVEKVVKEHFEKATKERFERAEKDKGSVMMDKVKKFFENLAQGKPVE